MPEQVAAITTRDWLQIAINAAILSGGLVLFNWRVGVLETRLEHIENTFVRQETLDAKIRNVELEIQLSRGVIESEVLEKVRGPQTK